MDRAWTRAWLKYSWPTWFCIPKNVEDAEALAREKGIIKRVFYSSNRWHSSTYSCDYASSLHGSGLLWLDPLMIIGAYYVNGLTWWKVAGLIRVEMLVQLNTIRKPWSGDRVSESYRLMYRYWRVRWTMICIVIPMAEWAHDYKIAKEWKLMISLLKF